MMGSGATEGTYAPLNFAIFRISVLQDDQDQECPRAETHRKQRRNGYQQPHDSSPTLVRYLCGRTKFTDITLTQNATNENLI